MATQAASQQMGVIRTLGPLIHNPQAVESLARMGIEPIESLADIDDGTVIIRSHGVPPGVYDEARERNIKLIDATCPFVRRCMRRAKELADSGYQVVIVGEAEHPEVIALRGYVGAGAIVAGNSAELTAMELVQRVGCVAQTTQSLENYQACVSVLLARAEELKVYNTICTATAERQSTALELASNVDVMLVVGGRNSANTTRLAKICAESGARTYHIETANEIRPEWFQSDDKVGVTAGASTPTWSIEGVMTRMAELDKEMKAKEENEEVVAVDNQEVQDQDGEMAEIQDDTGQDATETSGAGDGLNQDGSSAADAQTETETGIEQEAEEQEEEAGAEDTDDTETVLVEEEEKEERSEQAEKMAQYDKTFVTLHPGQIVKGTVVQINDDEVLVDIGYKSEGILPFHELGPGGKQKPENVVKRGDEIDVYVMKVEDAEGNVLLSKRRADAAVKWRSLQKAYENDEIIEARVKERVKGGLLVDVGVRGFVPASHVDRNYVEDLDKYVSKNLRLKIIELDKRRNNVVLSRKEVLEEEYEQCKQEIFSTLEEGQIVEGVVRRITDFGAFVDIGNGVEGLLHVSEMAWSRVRHPSDVVSEGEKIKVMVLRIDRDKERISLGLKQTLPDPWEDIGKRYEVGDVVTGEVTRVVDFGAFVKLEDGVEGLVHISQLADRHVDDPEEVVSSGDEVAVKIVSIDEEARRIGLSIKEVEQEASAPRTGNGSKDNVTIGDVYGNLSDFLDSLNEDES